MEKSQELGALLERGLQLFGLGQQAEAISLWRQVLELDPNNGRAHEYLRFVQGEGVPGNGGPLAGVKSQVLPSAVPESGQACDFSLSQATGHAALDLGLGAVAPTATQLGSAFLGSQSWGDLIGAGPQSVAPALVVSVVASATQRAKQPTQDIVQTATVEVGEDAATQSNLIAADDPWEEGESVTETVTLAAEDEFLEPLSGEFSIEEHPDDPGSNPEILMAPEHAAKASAPSTVEDDCENLMQGAIDMFALGDFSGSLDLVEQVLKLDPDNAAAKDYLERNQDTLLQMYESKIGSFSKVPRVSIPPDEVIWLNLHHRAGFLLSQIDGTVSYDDIMSLSGMSKLETCKILVGLIRDGVIQN